VCYRARFEGEPETLTERFGATKPMDNRFDPTELYPKSRTYVVREEDCRRGLDVMHWDVAAGQAS
jgi:hypothetical protein